MVGVDRATRSPARDRFGRLPFFEAVPEMNARTSQSPIALSIASVERDTGLSKDTLRVWERRYGFPSPMRDALGERVYPLEQVDKLRTLKRLLDLGHRPGRIVGQSIDELQRLARSSGNAAARGLQQMHAQDDLTALIALLTEHRIDELRGQLSQKLLRMGLARFVAEIVAPLNEMVGEAWTRGKVQIFEEHLYTETVQGLLRNAIGTIPRVDARPRVLLTTFPQEPHGLGLLMAEAMFALDGCHCISLGVQTPVWDILLAAEAQRADIVALSFSAAVNPHQAIEGLAELRAKLPSSVQVWAGGSCPALHRRPPAQVLALRALEEIGPAVVRWRQAATA
jgi:DNA-binding transcriptional MerR regulator/methylmalonyl-CoA mutase cobalamin-binding subunit